MRRGRQCCPSTRQNSHAGPQLTVFPIVPIESESDNVEECALDNELSISLKNKYVPTVSTTSM